MIASEFETATRVLKNRNASKDADSGGFVLWQMNPDMWYVELAVGGSKVHAGCNGKLVWRHTPWLGAHSAKGPVRPLRRALQVKLYMIIHLLSFWFSILISLLIRWLYCILYFRALIQEPPLVCLLMQDALEKRRSMVRIALSSSYVLTLRH